MGELRTREELEIGIVLDFPFPGVVAGARSYCGEHGINVDARWSVRGDWVIPDPQWDGVIYKITSNKADSLKGRVASWAIPKVTLLPDGDELLVCHDYYMAGCMAAEEFRAMGVKRALVGKMSGSVVDTEYCRGCVEQMYRFGGTARLEDYTGVTGGVTGAAQKACEDARHESVPIGLCVAHAGLAMSIQKALMQEGLRVPEEVAMVVQDKDLQETAALCPVPLTGIVMDDWMQGYVAAEMLHKQMAGQQVDNRKITVPPKGIKRRESTGHLSEHDPIMAKALSFIRKHYTEQITVADVVEAVGASRRVVEMRFREILDRGVGEEINRLRMEYGKRLLRENRHKIAEVAEMAGFSSLHYFSAAFKRNAGVSPRTYQTQMSGR